MRVEGADGRLTAEVIRPDGSAVVARSGMAPRSDAARLGAEIGQALRAAMPPDFFTAAGLAHG